MPLMRSRLLFQPSELHSVVESRDDYMNTTSKNKIALPVILISPRFNYQAQHRRMKVGLVVLLSYTPNALARFTLRV
jgi:hypothetical protein